MTDAAAMSDLELMLAATLRLGGQGATLRVSRSDGRWWIAVYDGATTVVSTGGESLTGAVRIALGVVAGVAR